MWSWGLIIILVSKDIKWTWSLIFCHDRHNNFMFTFEILVFYLLHEKKWVSLIFNSHLCTFHFMVCTWVCICLYWEYLLFLWTEFLLSTLNLTILMDGSPACLHKWANVFSKGRLQKKKWFLSLWGLTPPRKW